MSIRSLLHHFFIPSHKNNYRSKALHLNFLTAYLIIAVLLTAVYKPLTTISQHVLGVASDITVEKLLQLTNEERAKVGDAPLTYNNALAQAAEAKGKNMFAKNYWAHYGPDGSTPWDFILGAGYKYEYAGENLAKDFDNSQGVVNAWMNSPTHRENIVKKEYTEIGFAIINGQLQGEETTLVVQMFGKPTAVAAVTDNSTPFTKTVVQDPPRGASNPNVKAVEKAPQVSSEPSIVVNEKKAPAFNIRELMIRISIGFFLILISALLLDLYFAHRMEIVRMTGKHLAHFIFIGFIILSILVIAQGAIL